MLGDQAMADLGCDAVTRENRIPIHDEVQLVHWWVTDGEKAGLDLLRDNLHSEQVAFHDLAIAGGANLNAHIQTAIENGLLPGAAVTSGFGAWDWAAQAVLADLSDLAAEAGWSNIIPDALQKFCKYQDRWIGVPVALHSINWLWINSGAAETNGVRRPPATMAELFSALKLAKQAGIVPMAMGAAPWLIATLFDCVVMGTNGLDFYKRAFVDLSTATLTSSAMTEAFENLATLADFANTDYSRLSWNDATDMVVNGRALLQVSGDWAKAEFRAARKTEGDDYRCIRFPGTEGTVIFNADIIAMFRTAPRHRPAQMKLAKAIMGRSFQSSFNDAKGAAPVRLDIDIDAFDAHGKRAIADVRTASSGKTLIGAMSHGYIQPTHIQNTYLDVSTMVFHGDLAADKAGKAFVDLIGATP